MPKEEQHSQIIIYQAEDGRTRINVQFEGETVWLTLNQIGDLFQKSKATISEHLSNIYDEGELMEEATVRKFRTVQEEGGRLISRNLEHYNLNAIIAVGYRVRSTRGTQFRMWATERLREFIIKGFALDDERLKQAGGKARYFEELLQRIRDIRASERMFYQKITDIYATSVDYQKNDELTQKFYATVQNKMHFAVHGHTAAEIIVQRSNGKKPQMGLTSFRGKYITLEDARIAKNYLSEEELKQLNLIVSLYLDFAELQATNQRAMKMNDWIKKLDEFLKLSEKQVLLTAGSVSAEQARSKAEQEFEKYRMDRDRNYVSDFDREVKRITVQRKKPKNSSPLQQKRTDPRGSKKPRSSTIRNRGTAPSSGRTRPPGPTRWRGRAR